VLYSVLGRLGWSASTRPEWGRDEEELC
jgi:hypothetical protein